MGIGICVGIIALCIIFVISIISDNKEIPMLTSANYEKTIGWGIKREKAPTRVWLIHSQGYYLASTNLKLDPLSFLFQ